VAATFLSGTGSADLSPLLRFWDHMRYPAWQGLEQAIRSDQSQTHHGGFSEEEQRIFSAGVEALTASPAEALASGYDWSRHRRPGSWRRYGFVSARCPQATSRAGRHAVRTADCGAGRPAKALRGAFGQHHRSRCGDFFSEPLPKGHDAVIVANVAHLFSPEQNVEVLRRIRESVASGARLLLVDFWTDPGHTEPRMAALLAAEFLIVAGHGDVYSEAQVRGWLRETGWRFVERVALGSPASLIVAENAA
jgi:hypothetical protein